MVLNSLVLTINSYRRTSNAESQHRYSPWNKDQIQGGEVESEEGNERIKEEEQGWAELLTKGIIMLRFGVNVMLPIVMTVAPIMVVPGVSAAITREARFRVFTVSQDLGGKYHVEAQHHYCF